MPLYPLRDVTLNNQRTVTSSERVDPGSVGLDYARDRLLSSFFLLFFFYFELTHEDFTCWELLLRFTGLGDGDSVVTDVE